MGKARPHRFTVLWWAGTVHYFSVLTQDFLDPKPKSQLPFKILHPPLQLYEIQVQDLNTWLLSVPTSLQTW